MARIRIVFSERVKVFYSGFLAIWGLQARSRKFFLRGFWGPGKFFIPGSESFFIPGLRAVGPATQDKGKLPV